jgi:hypothetical protein
LPLIFCRRAGGNSNLLKTEAALRDFVVAALVVLCAGFPFRQTLNGLTQLLSVSAQDSTAEKELTARFARVRIFDP